MLHAALLGLLALSTAMANPTIKDCAPGGSAVKIKTLDVEPHPIRVPGMVRLYLDAEVMRPFTNFDLNVTLVKEVNGEKLTVPCLENLGSCYYREACPFLDLVFPTKECPPFMSQCTCPFSEHKLTVNGLVFTIPTVPPVIKDILTGRFELILALVSRDNGKVLSCLNLKLELDVAGYLTLL